MAKEMLINVSEGEECRIALVDGGRLEELYMERTSSTSHVGNIYKGRVTNVEPSIQAAFIDFGLGRNGFLHISDLMPSYFGRAGEEVREPVGRKLARRDRPPIQRCLRRGDEIVVQIIKEGIGTKGPTLTTYLSIPGRILVMMPGMSRLGVSRKIEDEAERRRLRQILDQLKPPRDAGFIIRTAGVGKTKADIQKDLAYLTRLLENINAKRASGAAPQVLYTEGDLVTRTVRDVFTPDIERIIVDNAEVAARVEEFIKIALPRTRNKVEIHRDPVPLFHKYGIEKEIEQMYSRHVPLPSGGSLVIDSTEAIVAIDVNSGRFRDHADAEMTAFKTDLEAADEIPRQLRLRDLGGVIICDFIDLRYERHRRELEKRLADNLKQDRAKTKMLRMSQFGIIEMTRQRMRPSLKRSIYFDCPHCKGAGLVKTPESMALDVMRRLAIAMHDPRVQRVQLTVSMEVAQYLQNRKRSAIARLEADTGKPVLICPDAHAGMDAIVFELFDARDGLVFLEELGMTPPLPGQALPPRHGGHGSARPPALPPRHARRHDEPRRRPGPDEHTGRDEEEDDLDFGEEAVDRREGEQLLPDEPPSGDALMEPLPPPVTTPAPGPTAAPPAAPAGQEGGRSRRRRRGRGRGRGRGSRDQGPATEANLPTTLTTGPADSAEDEHSEGLEIWDVAVPAAEPAGWLDEADDRAAGPAPQAMASDAPAPAPQREPAVVDVDLILEEAARVERPGRRPAPSPTPAPIDVETEESAATSPAEQTPTDKAPTRPRKRTRRGSRGGRGHRKKASTNVEPAPATSNPPPPPRSTAADKHLANDEPVDPQPVYRPRTYRDLDHIPDDLD